ncbi:MAG: type II secretion system protein [Acidobacteria bacterium]|nr:type II secretion system protein [Acidobacteriota bacterium]MBI3658146.1 type II secretion system protein [Acidobacteriota bacterium]
MRRNRKANGFTLMEVVVALAVLGIAVGAAMQLISGSFKQIRSIGNHVTAAQVADAVMNDLLLRDEVDHPGELAESYDENYRWRAVMDEIVEPLVVPPGMPASFTPQEPPLKKISIDLTVYWRNRFSESSLKLFTIKLAPNERAPGAPVRPPPRR